MAGDEYPKREKFFAHKVVRALFKTCAAQEIGTTATLLVTMVAHTEDAKRYTGSVTFFNSQLLPILGIRKWDTLSRARQAAVNTGWLYYNAPPSGTRAPGIYWTLIPARFGDIDDAPLGEEASPPNGDGRGDGRGEPSTLSPSPKKESTIVDSSSGVAADDSKPKASDLLKLWNATPGIRPARKMGQKRCELFHARLSEDATWWDLVPVALEKVAASSFCRGGGGQGWVADLDWFLRPGTMNKILEGKYDDKPTGRQPGTVSGRFRGSDPPDDDTFWTPPKVADDGEAEPSSPGDAP